MRNDFKSSTRIGQKQIVRERVNLELENLFESTVSLRENEDLELPNLRAIRNRARINETNIYLQFLIEILLLLLLLVYYLSSFSLASLSYSSRFLLLLLRFSVSLSLVVVVSSLFILVVTNICTR